VTARDITDDARPLTEVPAEADAGWNAREVWRDRVRDARTEVPGRPRPDPAAAQTDGWDPLRTWRERVLRPRDR
jgi:hypothetical protein